MSVMLPSDDLRRYAQMAELMDGSELPARDDGEDFTAMRKLADQLKLLAAADATMRTSGTVYRGQVEELVGACDLALDARYPVASFTAAPSAQNLHVATESIGNRAAEVIRTIIRKAGELIMKLARWIAQAVARLKNRFRPIHQRIVYSAALVAAIDELKPVVDVVAADPSATTAFAQAHELYAAHCNNLAVSLLTGGPLLSLLKSISLHMPRLATGVADKVEYAEKTLATQQDPMLLAQSLAVISQPLPMGRLTEFANALPEVHQAQTLIEYFEQLKGVTTRLHDSHPDHPMDWVTAVNAMINPHSGFDEPLIGVPDMIGKLFDQLASRVSHLMHPQVKDNIDSALASAFDQAMISLVGDVHALTFYVEAVNLVLDDQAMIADALFQCARAQFELYRSAGQAAGNPEWVEKINTVQHKLRDAITRRS